ncbi:hypothetical protein J1N35_044042 [Gossypium stocksii]|uniref:Uncharacterized protein n=1 Tax=Gossypium stocksii TaxID=47602 RepID=A0A9D3ZG12_9ROSI|nr:hypothetical protein J1N35_044042 [Gossypium stocksii]
MIMLQFGLPVDGYAVTRFAYLLIGEPYATRFWVLLRIILTEMSWLRDTFPEPDNDSTELERIQYAWAYILKMIRGYLMSNLSRNLIHLRWLLKLDFRAVGELSWESIVLATLYKEMCGVM